ncbi:MAG TPA: hypothetical protein VN032_07525 [Thermoanaerobaculia bacterium]|jgi:hypothetical protein|nr:hypothetical protein [Thermoanaerobaculia bacterium]
MSKEVRAVVLGLFVVVLAAIGLSFWQRPAAEFTRIKGFRVDMRAKDGDSTRKFSVDIPSNLIARIAKLAPVAAITDDARADWGKGDVTPRQILEAADESEPGKPGVIKKDDTTIEVQADGSVLEIDVKDDWDKHVHIRLPRILVEALSENGKISTSEILRKLDELGPGDVVTIKDKDSEVTITAEPRRHGLHIS